MTQYTLSPSQFVREKFGGSFKGHIVLWELPTKKTFSFAADELDRLDSKVAEIAVGCDLYLALGTQADRPKDRKRGGADGVLMLPGFVADIDFGDAKGQPNKYPPNEEATLKVLHQFSFKPTTIVRTGGGLHAHWDLEQPLLIKSDQDRENAKALWSEFQQALQQHFSEQGFQIDSVGDLCRLYRLPGSRNYKSKPAKPVEVIEQGGKIALDTVRTLLSEASLKAGLKPTRRRSKKDRPADHDRIRDRCAWYRDVVVDSAATCSEPDWFAGASITARCKDGEAIFHEYSAKHPSYSHAEAAAMLKRVSGERSGPRTCKSVREQLGHEAICAACPHCGKVTSPIQLGYHDRAAFDPGEEGPIPLGYSGSDYFFRKQQTNQVVKKSTNQLMVMAGLLDLAPLAYWKAAFADEIEEINQAATCDTLVQACLARGPLSASKIRGAGVWREVDRIVVNLGGEPIDSDQFVYNQPPEPLMLSAEDPPTEALYALLKTLNWKSESSPALLFGWTVSSVICGALPWRPHIAITGPVKAGKTTVLMAIAETLKPMAIVLDGSSTEAGIRQHLGPSARPVLLDEFDVRTRAEAANAERVARLMRSASSAAANVARGTPEGRAFNFSINAAFLVAGINVHVGGVADSSRIIRLELAQPEGPEQSRAELRRLQAEIEGKGPAFCNMAIGQARDILASIPIIQNAIAGVDARQADNFSVLLAGFFVGMNRRAIMPDEALKLVADHREAIDEHAEAQGEDDPQECLNALLGHLCVFTEFRISTNSSIGQLLTKVFKGGDGLAMRTEILGQHGIRIEGNSFIVANSHPQLARIFQSTPWAGGLWKSALSRLPGAEKLGQRRFVGGPVSRTVKIPKALAAPPEEDDQVVTPSLVSREF